MIFELIFLNIEIDFFKFAITLGQVSTFMILYLDSWASVYLHNEALSSCLPLFCQPKVAPTRGIMVRSWRIWYIISAQDENIGRWNICCIGGAPNHLWFQWTLALCENRYLNLLKI